MAARNLAAEKNAVDIFAKTKGKLPNSSQDWADVHKMAYPTLNDLPDQFKGTEAASYYGATGTPSSPAPIAPGGMPPFPTPAAPTPGTLPQDQSNLKGLAGNVDTAKANLDQLSSPNSALNILQEAIKAKTQSANASIGTSKIFDAAGVGGYGALSQSLSARGNEIATNATDFHNVINQMSGTYRDMAQTALERYQMAQNAYDKETSRIQSIQDDLRNNEQAIKLAKLQHDLSADLARVNNGLISPSDKLNAIDKGYEFDANGNLQTPEPTTAEANDLADAIAQHESGGNYNAKGATGESGAFQFMPATWSIVSQQYAQANGINQSLPMTKENEDKVARWKIGALLAAGNTPRQVALIWNGSLGGSEQGVVKSGVNSKGVKYDTGAYADAVMNILKNKTKDTGTDGKFTPAFYATPTGQKVRDDERSLQQIYLANQNVKDYQAVQSQYQGMQKVLSSGVGGPGDLDLVYSFMKGLDPNSVVRESEFDSAAKSGNIFQGVFAKYNGYLKDNGGFLPDKVKQSFIQLVKNKVDVKKAAVDDFSKKIQDQAARQGLNPANVTIDFTVPDSDGSNTPTGDSDMEDAWANMK